MPSGPHSTELMADGPTQKRYAPNVSTTKRSGASSAITAPRCGAVGVPSAAWDETPTFIRQGIESIWSKEPDPLVPWDRESGPVPRSYSVEELLEAAGAPIRSESVIEEIVRTRDYVLSSHGGFLACRKPQKPACRLIWSPQGSYRAKGQNVSCQVLACHIQPFAFELPLVPQPASTGSSRTNLLLAVW